MRVDAGLKSVAILYRGKAAEERGHKKPWQSLV